jgi:thioredoxin-related protein
MNKLLIFIAFIFATTLLSSASKYEGSTLDTDDRIHWLTWDEAIALNKENPKKIFIDVYTEWCGWCKRMDATTFIDSAVVQYMNAHFYAVKFDAEMKDNITFQDQEFKYVKYGKRGMHTLAYSLLEGKASYPSFVTLTETFERIAISPGYKQPEQLIKELKFAAEEKYKVQDWSDFND